MVFLFCKLHFLQNYDLLGVMTRGRLLDKHDLFHLVIYKVISVHASFNLHFIVYRERRQCGAQTSPGNALGLMSLIV